MISQTTDQFLHCHFCPRLLLLKSSRDTKRMVRNDWVLMIFQFFCSPFFNEIAIFSANAPHMILQPTDQFSPRCFCCPLTIIKKQQWHKKNGEKEVSVDYFSVLLLTFSSMKFYFQCPCTTHDIAAHRPIFATILPLPARIHYNQATMQKEW